MSEYKTCKIAVYAKPEYSPLLAHLPEPATWKFSMAQMTNESVLTPQEAMLFASWTDAISGCFNTMVAAVQPVRPDLAVIMDNDQAALSQIAVQLVERKITWGEAVRQSQRITAEAEAQLMAANQQWMVEENAAHQAELTLGA